MLYLPGLLLSTRTDYRNLLTLLQGVFQSYEIVFHVLLVFGYLQSTQILI